jgi:macrophage erythroblast attacher
MDQWDKLADKFVNTHHKLFGLPNRPLLHIALTAGLSALKTPACHSKYVSPSSGLNTSRSPPPGTSDFEAAESQHEEAIPSPLATLLNTPVCPICSTELNKLALKLPFAHHSKSHVENEPVVLPNGRIYGRDRLLRLNEQLGTPDGEVRDPVEPEKMFRWDDVRKVFIM